MFRRIQPAVYDPPEGWRYGFPKAWPPGVPYTTQNLARQLEADGYPKSAIPAALNHTRVIGDFEAVSYGDWLILVDEELYRFYGVTQSDLPDWLSRDAYDAGTHPEAAAHECWSQSGIEQLVDEL